MGSNIGFFVLGIIIGELVALAVIALTSKNHVSEERE